jgi:hypothetical protein
MLSTYELCFVWSCTYAVDWAWAKPLGCSNLSPSALIWDDLKLIGVHLNGGMLINQLER